MPFSLLIILFLVFFLYCAVVVLRGENLKEENIDYRRVFIVMAFLPYYAFDRLISDYRNSKGIKSLFALIFGFLLVVSIITLIILLRTGRLDLT
ncbi:MAG: hypothetical protein MK078_15240 [Crocinitomicaceae bacterium]|nr:hypothetical protein [Crocinitomicaceae bacterium]